MQATQQFLFDSRETLNFYLIISNYFVLYFLFVFSMCIRNTNEYLFTVCTVLCYSSAYLKSRLLSDSVHSFCAMWVNNNCNPILRNFKPQMRNQESYNMLLKAGDGVCAWVEWLLAPRAMAITLQPMLQSRKTRHRCLLSEHGAASASVLCNYKPATHPSWKLSYLQMRNSEYRASMSALSRNVYIFKLENAFVLSRSRTSSSIGHCQDVEHLLGID